jgi:hypothetical protein
MKNIIYTILCLLFFGCSSSYTGELIFIEPSVGDNFTYPYFLFIPKHTGENEEVYLVIEPNNSGFADDDLKKHIDKAGRIATHDFYPGNYIAQKLNYPLLVPVFPRPMSEWKIYTHALDRDVMLQKDNPMERLDLQLNAMFADAQSRLKNKNIKAHKQFILTGFSASGTFANRFAVLHPDKVFAVAAGGLNGLLMLPMDSLNNEILQYPVGTRDIEELTNRTFQEKLFINTPQFYFMGELDDNDAVPFEDAFSQNEREQIYRLLGTQMQPERWNNCIHIYDSLNVNATIKTYDETGHEHPEKIKKELIEFVYKNIKEKKLQHAL